MYEYYSLNLFIPGGMSIGKRKLMLVGLGTWKVKIREHCIILSLDGPFSIVNCSYINIEVILFTVANKVAYKPSLICSIKWFESLICFLINLKITAHFRTFQQVVLYFPLGVKEPQCWLVARSSISRTVLDKGPPQLETSSLHHASPLDPVNQFR